MRRIYSKGDQETQSRSFSLLEHERRGKDMIIGREGRISEINYESLV